MRPRGLMRGRATAVACAALAWIAPACSGDDGGSVATTVASSPGTTAARVVDLGRSLLTASDLPEGWEVRTPSRQGSLDAVCPAVASDDAASAEQVEMAARAPAVGLPAVRQQVLRYPDAASAAGAFDDRATGERALCLAAFGVETLEQEGGVLAGRGFRAADPGPLGDEARTWVLSFTVEEQGVRLDGSFEITTFRVGPVVGTLLLTTSPLFPLTSDERRAIVAAAVSGATAVAPAATE